MPYIVKGYACDDHTPITKGLGLPCDEQTEVCGITEVGIENVVVPYYENLGLTGLYSDHPFQHPFEKIFPKMGGWEWDKRRLESFKSDRTLYKWQLGGHEYGLKDGTRSWMWQSGSLFNTEYLKTKSYKFNGEFLSWTPIVKSGQYSVLFEPKTLFSDYSSTEKYILDNVDYTGGWHHQLRADARTDTIDAVLFRRDENFINWPYEVYKFVDLFTGELEEDLTRLVTSDYDLVFETVGGGADYYSANPEKVIWENCSKRLYEYILWNDENNVPSLYFNRDPSKVIGDLPEGKVPTAKTLDCLFEVFGNGNENGRDCFTEYFPLAEDSVRVFIKHMGKVEEWTQVENLYFSTPDDKHYTVDHDLGIITLGGYKAPDLRLKEPIDSEASEILCYVDDDAFASYPPQGTIIIDGEEILYYGKGRSRFYDCVRGFGNTTAEAHDHGALVSDKRHGQGSPVSATIYAGYKAVPRIQYEVTTSEERSANRAPFIDLKAIKNAVTNNIIQISPVEVHVANLVLETDSPVISEGNLYGPVYYGTDFSRLTARATDSIGNPVDGIKITIVLDSDVGSLNGGFKKITGISNSLGEVYAIYNAPYEWESIRKAVHEVTHKNGNTTFKVDKLPPGVSGSEVTVFQTYKFDRNIGTVGTNFNVISASDSYGLGSGPWPGGAGNPDGDVYSVNASGDAIEDVINASNIVIDAVFEDPASQWKSWQRTDTDLPYHGLHDGDDGTGNTCPGGMNTNYGNAVVSILFRHNDPNNNSTTMIHRKIWDAFDVYGPAEDIVWSADDPSIVCPDVDNDGNPDYEQEHKDAHDEFAGKTVSRRSKIGTRFVFRTAIPASVLMNYTAEQCWAHEKDAEVWNTTFKDGLDVVLYEWNDDIPHPITTLAGAFYPVRPDQASATEIIFNGKELPIPNPSNNWPGIENILGGYNVVCPDMVEFYAWCRDPVSGKVILSNRIRLKLVIPPYLEGVDFSGALPVPRGFGFVSDEHNIVLVGGEEDSEVGTGIGGANFLTINPIADSLLGGANAFSIQLDP